MSLQANAPPFRNPALDPEVRIDNLLSLMTLDEKIDCLGTHPSVPHLGIKGSGHVEGLHGLALGGPGHWGGKNPVPTTTFPQAIGLAETWDPEVVRYAADIEAHEARYAFQSKRYERGGLVVRAPNADMGRDPRWGRTEECFGEDPYLNGVMAAAFTRGLQGEHPRYWKTASLLKHFFANSNENGRDRTSSDFDERLFREYYSVPFRMAIEAGSRAFMAAYNAHNGIPCTTHPFLREVAIDEWRQNGIICTDATAMTLLVTAHKQYSELPQAAAASVKAGITQFLDEYKEAVKGALAQGLLALADIDGAVRKNFRVMIRLGLLDPPEDVPYSSIGESDVEPWTTEAHKGAVLEATMKSVVLLKNEGALLPFDEKKVRSIAVLGPLADRVLIDWYSGTPPYTVSPALGIRNRLGAEVTVKVASNNDDSDQMRLAKECDVCVVCVGNHPTGEGPWAHVTRKSYGKEAVDRESLELEDEKLVKQVYENNPRTVVALISSFPYAIGWTQENVPAIVHLSHNSQELGNALAKVLFGDFNPAGRLVQTWPRKIEDLPPMMDYDLRHGRTYMYFEGEPLYPFGYGLSYSTFSYGSLRASSLAVPIDGSIVASIEVKNAGARAGDEVVQLYARYLASSVSRPRRSLVGFRRIPLGAGEMKTVEMPFAARDLAYWDVDRKRFVVEEGQVELMVGSSSAQIHARRVVSIPAHA
jgi:beta-glucosidase